MKQLSKFKSLLLVTLLLFVALTPALANQEEILVSDMYYDTYILDAFNNLSIQSGISIIADSSVGGFITIEFEDIPLEDALRMICVPFGLTYKYMPGDYYLVSAAKVDNPTFAILSDTAVYKTPDCV